MHRAEAKCWRNVFHGKSRTVKGMTVSMARLFFKLTDRVFVMFLEKTCSMEILDAFSFCIFLLSIIMIFFIFYSCKMILHAF